MPIMSVDGITHCGGTHGALKRSWSSESHSYRFILSTKGLCFPSVLFYKAISLAKSITVQGKMRELAQAGHMPHAGCWATNVMCIISSTPHNNIQCWCCYPHFTREGRETQRAEALVPSLRVISRWRWGQPCLISTPRLFSGQFTIDVCSFPSGT